MKKNANKFNNTGSPSRNFYHDYEIPYNFDKTPNTLLPLDYYLLDSDICTLLKKLFSEVTNWSNWAMEYKNDAALYFSPSFKDRTDVLLLGFKDNDSEE
jgi:hypothetical protein